MTYRHHCMLLVILVFAMSVACESKKQDVPEPDEPLADGARPSHETRTEPTNEPAATSSGDATGLAGPVKQLPYEDKSPAGIEMKFPITHALGWRDSKGENALVFAQQTRTERGKSIQELQIRHARRATKEGPWETVRDFKELVSKCDGTALIEVAATEWKVSDLDADGVGEATFAYTAGCVTSGSTPLGHKVLMIEDGEKYALRGTKESYGEDVVVDAAGNPMGETHGGDFKPDFLGAPKGFQVHATSVWRATASVAAPDRAGDSAHDEQHLVEGEFLDTHEVLVDADTEEMGETTDCLSIWRFEDGALEFGIELNFDLDHSCSLHGQASPIGDNTWVHKREDCTFELVFARDYIEIKDESGGCRETWCGARGHFDGIRFPTRHKREDTKKWGGGGVQFLRTPDKDQSR